MNDGYQQLVDLLAEPAPDRNAATAVAGNADRAPPGASARLYGERRRRERWFGSRLFWEPSWDILLYLHAALEAGEDAVPVAQFDELEIAVSSDSVGRWIALLRDQKLVALDTRRGIACLSLTQYATNTMADYLQAVAPAPALLDRPRVA